MIEIAATVFGITMVSAIIISLGYSIVEYIIENNRKL